MSKKIKVKDLHIEVYNKINTYTKTMSFLGACIKCGNEYGKAYRTIENYYYAVKRKLEQPVTTTQQILIEATDYTDLSDEADEIVAEPNQEFFLPSKRQSIDIHGIPVDFSKSWQDIWDEEERRYVKRYIWNVTNTCIYNVIETMLQKGYSSKDAFTELNTTSHIPMRTLKDKYGKAKKEKESLEKLTRKNNPVNNKKEQEEIKKLQEQLQAITLERDTYSQKLASTEKKLKNAVSRNKQICKEVQQINQSFNSILNK